MRALFLNQAGELARLSGARLEAARQILAHTRELAHLSAGIPSGRVPLQLLRWIDNRQRFINLYEELDRTLRLFPANPGSGKFEDLPAHREAEALLQLAAELDTGVAERFNIPPRVLK